MKFVPTFSPGRIPDPCSRRSGSTPYSPSLRIPAGNNRGTHEAHIFSKSRRHDLHVLSRDGERIAGHHLAYRIEKKWPGLRHTAAEGDDIRVEDMNAVDNAGADGFGR